MKSVTSWVCRRKVVGLFTLVALVLPTGRPAQAVIKPDMDLGTRYGVYNFVKQALIGSVAAVDGGTGIVDVEIAEDLSRTAAKGQGEPFEKKQRLDLKAVPEVLCHVQVGKPVVILVARKKGGMIHIADAFCPAEESPEGTPPTWVIPGAQPWSVFPAVTPALVQAIRDLAAGKGYTELNGVAHWMFPRYRKVIELGGRPEMLACADVNGDGIPDVLAVMADGSAQLHVATAGGYETTAFRNATGESGLAGLKAKVAGFGDVNGDGKPDLLLDGGLYVNQGGKFAATGAVPVPAGDWLACGIGDADGDGRNDAALATRDGQLHVFVNGPVGKPWKALTVREMWKEDPARPTQKGLFGMFGYNGNLHLMVVRSDGPYRYPVDPDDGREMDLDHLAHAFKGKLKPGMKCVALTGLRTQRMLDKTGTASALSLIIFTPAGKDTDIALMNRGYGAYLLNGRVGLFRHKRTEGHKSAGARGALLITPVAATSGDFIRKDGLDEMIFATDDGKVYEADNVGGALAEGWGDRYGFDPAGWDYKWVNETP